MSWLWNQFDAFVTTLTRFAHSPLAALLNFAVIGVALALPVGLYVALDNVQGLTRSLASEPQLSVFLALDVGHAEVEAIASRLRRHPAVRESRFIARDAALKELKAATGLADVVDSLPANPLPDAFVLTPANAAPEALERLRDEVRGWPKVSHVQLDAAWARRRARCRGPR